MESGKQGEARCLVCLEGGCEDASRGALRNPFSKENHLVVRVSCCEKYSFAVSLIIKFLIELYNKLDK